MSEANIFELAELGDKADAEKNRQAGEFARLGVEPPAAANINVFQQAEADLKKEKPEAPKDDEPGLLRRFFNTAKGIPIPMAGAYAGGAAGTALAPGIGTLIGTMLGGGGAEWLQQKMGVTEPSKTDIALTTAMPAFGRAIKPAWQLAKQTAVSTLASRPLVAEAAESLLKKWIHPANTAKDLYAAAEATKKVIPAGTTARAVDDLLSKETGRMPLNQKQEILDILGPIKDFVTVGRGRGFQMIRSQTVADAMADVRRLGLEAKRAFKADNSDLGNALNKVRSALLDDLEKAGVPEVKEASRAYRKEMALEDLGRMISKSEAGTKIRDFARENPLFKGAFNEKEMSLIDQISKKVQSVAPTGASGIIGRGITGGIGFGAGGFWGALMGLAGPEAVRKMFASPKGQQFIEKTLAGNYELGPEYAAMLAIFARSFIPRTEAEQ
jgi:hypothetical protein